MAGGGCAGPTGPEWMVAAAAGAVLCGVIGIGAEHLVLWLFHHVHVRWA
jgi:hypothetical protein